MRVENQRSRELAPLNINGCFPFLTCPPSFPVPLSFLFLSSPSRRAAQVTRYHTLTHHLSSWGWALVVMPTEERRLAAEEGSLSKNTWSQKIARGFSAARRAPEKGPSRRVTHHTSTVTPLCHCHTSSSCHIISVTLCHLARVVMPTEERRLVAEEGSLSKNTWSQKIARGLSRCR